MTYPNSNKFVESSGDSSLPLNAASSELVEAAFLALPDPVYIFDQNRVLTRFNRAAATLQGLDDTVLMGRSCCDMFWRVDGADGCVVDRALQTRQKVIVEILAGPESRNSISIIVEPLG